MHTKDIHFETPTIKIPQPDGSVLVRSGKPQERPKEILLSEFAKRAGVSHRTAFRMVDEGIIKNAHRLSPKPGSPFVVPITELDRILQERRNY